jgi:uncharacterized protein YrrD
MIIKGKDVIGLNVITIDTGTIIETVDDIAYDPTDHRIVALLVDSGGLFSSAKAIHMDDVRNIGEDAVIVHDASVIKSLKELSDSVRSISSSNKHLVKTKVVTVDGKELGRVTDIYFDSASGYAETMEVSQGGLKTITEGKKSIKPSDIVTIGADATIVSAYTEVALEAQGEEGGLTGALNDAKEKTNDFIQDAKEKTDDFVQDTRKVAKDVVDKTAAVTNDAVQNVSDNSNALRRRVSDKAEELRDVTEEKAAELIAATDETVKDVRKRTTKARVDAEEFAQDISDKTKENVRGTKEIIKDTIDNSSNTNHHSSDTLVKETKARFEDEEAIIETQKKVIKK